ncbi:MAG: serine hydrolase [Alphaproteobacteria bacterium]|nr:serine hydrolase [Alphaproteobacteria bacterium]
MKRPVSRRGFVLGAGAFAAAAFDAPQAAAQAASAGTLPGAGATTTAAEQTLLAYHAARGGRGLTVWRNGVSRIEMRAEAAAPLGEASSAFCMALAAALARDRMLDIAEPVAMSLSEFATPLKTSITVRHLLGRTCGLRAPASGLVTDALVTDPIAAPGALFDPNDAGLMIFAEVARRKLATRGLEADPADYLNRRVLAPVGAGAVRFAPDPRGWGRIADGAESSATALAAFGELIRRGGVWRARWLLDRETVSESQVANGATSRAGLGWWLGAGAPLGPDDPLRAVSDLWQFGPGLPTDLLMAAGHGGQRLYVIPSWRIVAARTAAPEATGFSDVAFLRALRAAL